MKLETINLLRYVIIACMCYVPTVTISGWFEACMAKLMGDTIPEKSGFLTLSPLVHFNPWGFCLMFVNISGFGFAAFGNVIPLTPEVLTNSWRNLRAAGEFFARPLIHFVMMFIAFLVMILVYKTIFIGMDSRIFIMQHQQSALNTALCTLFTFFFQQNFFLFVITFLVALYRLIIFIYFPGFQISTLLHSLFYILAFIVVILTLGMMLQDITQAFLFVTQYFLTSI